jgi:hypothetical protein
MISVFRNLLDENVHPVRKEPIQIPSCSLPKKECDAKHRRSTDGERMEWSCHECGKFDSSNGHVSFTEDSVPGDTYLPFNIPAHIQGTPAVFELSISAYEKDVCESMRDLRAMDTSVTELLELVRRDATPATVRMHLLSKCYSVKHRNNEIGETAVEILLARESQDVYQQDPRRLSEMKDLLCLNAFAHALFDDSLSNNIRACGATSAHECCWRCRAPLKSERMEIEKFEMERTLREDESLFGGGIESDPPNETFENASLAAFNRGVDIRWLELFTNFHNCWSWPTWRVVQNIIKPATAHSRVRYVDLPGVATAANVGKVNIFISHAWGGCFGGVYFSICIDMIYFCCSNSCVVFSCIQI